MDRWDELAATQDALDDAHNQAEADARRTAAARRACGPHAEPHWISETEISCRNNGNKTRVAKLTQAGQP